MQDGERPLQRNEGGWDFTLGESSDGQAIELEVAIGRYLDSSLVKADIQPKLARLLIKAGRVSLIPLHAYMAVNCMLAWLPP